MHRKLAYAGTTVFLVLAGVVAVAAQGQSKPERPATMDEIVAELRALRADVNRANGAALRAQLVVARLALQEQRINVIGREIAQVQEQLQANERNRPAADLLKSLMSQTDADGAKPKMPDQMHPFFEAMRNQAEHLDKADQELKNRHAELSRLLADEQSRWTSFNAQLEALERMLTGK